MCGIVGKIDFSKKSSSKITESVSAMLKKIAHRGPDDWGLVSMVQSEVLVSSLKTPKELVTKRGDARADLADLSLGHCRLSIIDLSEKGHQPMASADERFWITYNGEIYNYQVLRKELEDEGVTFKSTSDTEVLLALYQREGKDCLKKLRGMFAFAIWDEKEQKLFCARDRFGIKPFYYTHPAEGQLLFISELKGLPESPIEREAEVEFLERGSIQAPGTFSEPYQSLPPGSWMMWEGKTPKIEVYWSLEEIVLAPRPVRSIDDVAQEIKLALVDSVKAHMVSDVPVGIFLSGGIDSAAIVAAIRQFYQGPLKTFTLVFPGTEWDEGEQARFIAKQFDTEHAELAVTRQDFKEGLEEFFDTMDQPTVDGFNTFFVARMAQKAGIKVALSGVGGDELFGGYPSFQRIPKMRKLLRSLNRMPGLKSLAKQVAKGISSQWSSKMVQILESNPNDVDELWRNARLIFARDQIEALGLSSKSNESVRDPSAGDVNDFSSISYFEIKRFLIPQLLRDADNFTMCRGLELRTPFVDHQFLEAVCKIGLWSEKASQSPKTTLFQAMKDFLPKQCFRLPKKGFTLPFHHWLREELRFDDNSPDSRYDFLKLLDQPKYKPFVKLFLKGRLHWSRVWALYVLERFKQKLGVSGHE